MEMFEREISANFVVHDYGTHGVTFQFAANNGDGDAALLQVAEQVDVEKQPVGQNDQALNAAVQQHCQVALKAAAFVVHVGQNRQIRRLIQGILNTAQYQRAVGIG